MPDYSTVGATGGTATGTPASADGAPAPWYRRPPILIGIAVVIILVVILALVGGSHKSSKSSHSGPAVRGAHGPTSIVNGIPSGFTHDKVGAVTAAVDLVQALDQAGQGRVNADAVRTQMVAGNASPSLINAVQVASNRQPTDGVFNTLPAVVTVRQYNPDQAQVAVWALGTSQSKVSQDGKVAVQTLWSTTTVTVTWDGTDWRGSDWQFQLGPNPDAVTFPSGDSPLSQAGVGGYYSVYID